MLKNLLLYRLAVVNTTLAALFGYLGYKGYLAMALAGDPTGITIAVAALFLVVTASMLKRAWKTAEGMNWLKTATPVQLRVAPTGKPWTKRMAKIKHVKDASTWLAGLGLIGTMVGFVMALNGLDVGSLTELSGVQAMIPQMMTGMKVALFTSLAGLGFGMWNEVNYRMLATATECLNEDEKAQWDV